MNAFKIILIDGKKRSSPIIVAPVKLPIVSPIKSPTSSTLQSLGLEEIQLKDLMPKYTIVKKDEELGCGICYENYNPKEHKQMLHCNHSFHRKCIDKWFKTNTNCPMCRQELIN